MEPADLTIQQLKDITDGFSKKRLIGIGSYGKVYKGIHKNGDEVAVKMLHYQLGDEQFQELQNHIGLNHPNIVRVVGYCNEIQSIPTYFKGKAVLAEQRHRALCLEYMHNGSLQNHLSEESDGLDWHTRYKIIKGTCEGLQYLHEGYKVPIFHLDLKPDNILLDRNMVPKLADFGVSPFGERGTASILSPVGTIGYLAPEFLMEGDVSKKADIYSLGVVMLKIIAGPKGISKSAEMSRQEFIDLVQGNWRNRLQATLCGSWLEACCQQVKMCTEIALDCAEFDSHKRPSITAVIHKLNVIEEFENVPVSLVDKKLNDLGASCIESSWTSKSLRTARSFYSTHIRGCIWRTT